jgi:hypothetical protein
MTGMTEADSEGTFRPYATVTDEPVDPLWPTGLRRDPTPPFLVYLDLNHWIGLADVVANRPTGEGYKDALTACRAAKQNGLAAFPLSGTHYMEVSKIVDPSRRANLAAIMEELSDFMTLLSRVTVMRLELETALDQALDVSSSSLVADLIGWGVGHSVGVEGGPEFVDESGASFTAAARAKMGTDAFDQMLANMWLALERMIIRGPQNDAEVATLRARGWQPDAAVKVAQERADREIELVAILNAEPAWRKGRLRDVVSARELTHEIWEALVEGLVARGIPNIDSFKDREKIRQFTRSMPSTEVVIEMKTARHRNPSTKWDTKTIFDIDAMALSVPYCDAVVTERHACSILERAGFSGRMDVALMRRLDELVDWLARLRT